MQDTFKQYPDVLSIDQMSELLCISSKTGYKLLKSDKIKHFKIGRTYKIPKSYVLDFINGTN